MRDKSHDDDISRYVAATFMTRARKTRLTQLRTIGRNVIFLGSLEVILLFDVVGFSLSCLILKTKYG